MKINYKNQFLIVLLLVTVLYSVDAQTDATEPDRMAFWEGKWKLGSLSFTKLIGN